MTRTKQLIVSAIAVSIGVVGALVGIIQADVIKQQSATTIAPSTSNVPTDTIDQKDANGQDLETNDDQVNSTSQTQNTIGQDSETQDDKNVNDNTNEKPDSGTSQETED